MKKRIICIMLAAVMLLGCFLTGCSTPQGSSDVESTEASTLVPDKYIVQDGKTEYVLVLPGSPMKYETFATEEFNTFMVQATGCEFPVVAEDAVAEGTNYISIGNTKQLQAAFPDEDLSELEGTQSAYFIGTKGNNIYVTCDDGFRGYGSLYAIYDILHDLVGYTYYNDTEIYVDDTDSANLRNYEPHIVKPSFDMRTHSTGYIFSNSLHNTRLRYINFSAGEEWDKLTIGHSQLMKYVHPTDEDESGVTYGQSHPEWFVDPYETQKHINHNQLCWTAHGNEESLKEMQTVVANQMITYLQMNPDATFFMFGQHDNSDSCTCDGCRLAQEEWAGTPCGLQINFLNGVLEHVDAWLSENMPEREVRVVIYAYHFTESPPVKTDENGNYVPYSDKVIPNSRIGIFFAPVFANYAYPFESPVNDLCLEELEGWGAVCDQDQLYAYLYDLNCWNYFLNFYNFGTTQSIFKDLQEAGVSYLLDQGASDQCHVPGFQELKGYVTANLMWDVDRNYDELARDFIVHYYKDAAPSMQELYDMILDQNAYYATAIDIGMGTIQAYPTMTELYPLAFVEKMDEQIQNALASIEHYRDTDPEMFELLESRIMKEDLCVLYLKGVVYGDSYSEEEMAEIRETWNYYIDYFAMTKGGEGKPLPEF